MGFEAGQRAERGAALEWPTNGGQAAASVLCGRGSVFCGRCARASPGKPSWSGHAHPAVAAGGRGSDAGDTTSFPRQPSPAGLRMELSKLAGRGSVRRAARGERRTRKMASGARGLGSRGAAGPRGGRGSLRGAPALLGRREYDLGREKGPLFLARPPGRGPRPARGGSAAGAGGHRLLAGIPRFPPSARPRKAFSSGEEAVISPPQPPSRGLYLPSRAVRACLWLCSSTFHSRGG